MELITTHIGADFDALASVIAVRKLFPQAKVILPGSPEKSVRDFLSLWQGELKLDNENEIDFELIDKLIIVETRIPSRIGKAEKLLARKDIAIEIYDHHPRTRYDIKASLKDVYKRTGATITALLEILRRKKIAITPLEATVMALGIYEDTGSLTFQNTTRNDIDAVGYLFSQGASLNVVSSYLRRELTPRQLEILSELIKNTRVYNINSFHIGITEVESEEYVEDFAMLVHKLIDVENFNVIFAFVRSSSRIRMIARSHIASVRVNKIAEAFGGGGHPYAASAVIKDMEFNRAVEKLLNILEARIKPKISAEDIVPPMPKTPYVKEKTAASKNTADRPLDIKINVLSKMRENLDKNIFRILKIAGRLADIRGYSAFCVGGFVRDILMGVKNFDIDIVLEKEGLSFAKGLADILKGSLVLHKRFGTASIVTDLELSGRRGPQNRKEKFKIDIATARTEYYEYPAALPTVSFSSIKQDLYRRDFTINAMAVSLNKKSFGRLIDFFDGQMDIKSKKIRVLHDLSFVEDPTRIFRAVRFEQRYNFTIDPHTQNLIKTAVSMDMFGRTQKQRLRDEIILILSEEKPYKALMRMHHLHELRFIYPKIRFSRRMLSLFKAIDGRSAWYRSSFSTGSKVRKRILDDWLIYFFAIIDEISLGEAKSICEKFIFTKGDEKRIISCKKDAERIRKVLESRFMVAPSRIYRCLEPLSYEVIIFIMAKTKVQRARERISIFLKKYNGAKPLLGGKDLKAIGIKPGPEYKNILNKILYERLDGRIESKEQEIRLAMRLGRKV